MTDTQSPHTVEQVTEADRLIEQLRRAAEQSSQVQRQMAEAKSLRQEGNAERRADLYMWPTPEQTLEGRAAAMLARLTTAARQLCPHCNGEGDIDDGDHPCMKCGGSGYTPARQPSAPSLDALREAITKLRDRYKSQMKFCDIDPLPYFRDFVRELDAALSTPVQDAETVERVARGIHERFNDGGYGDYSYPWEHPMSSADMFRDLARAALAALQQGASK